MTSHLIVAIVAGVISSGLTLACALVALQKIVLPKVMAQVESDLLPKFREEVANGAMDAGEELLPQFRENVRLGFKDAMKDTVKDGMSGQLMEGAAKSVAKSMEMGLSGLLKK